ncbi:vegetative incompatibility protein HET-E-1, partial [Rhizoctonia solani 123E]
FSPSKLIHYVDDARSFVTSFAVNPTSQSTPHIYLSSLSLCPYASMVHQHYGKRSRGLLELKGSLMEVREGAPLAVWNVGLDITAFALSPDGTRVAIGCRDTAIYILSAYDGTTQIGPLQGHIDYVSSVAFSLDGGRVVAGSRDGITVWNAHNGIIIAGPFTGYLGLVDVSFSPDGQYIVSGGYDRIIRVRNARNGIPLWGSIDHGDVVYCVRISSNGALIAAPSSDYNIQLWNLEDGTPAGSPLTGHTGLVQCLAFTPCSTRLVSGSRDQTVRVWNISDGSLVTGPFEAHTNSIDSIAISPDGLRVASSDSSTVQVWKINDGTLVAGPFYGVTPSLRSMSYSPDGTRIIFSGSRCIYVRSVRDSMFPPPPPPPQDAVMQIGSVSFCPDNVHFLSGDVQCTIRVWDSSSGSFITSPNKAKFFPTPFCVSSPDGSLIVSRSESGDLQFVNTTDGSLVAGP